MDDPLSTTGNHLTREIKAAFCDAVTGQNGQEKIDRVPRIYSGAAGLGSRDVRPGDIIAAFQNMMKPTARTSSASASTIRWPCTRPEDPDLRPTGGFSMRGHSVGGFGSVTTNKVIATIAGNVFGKDVQAYPKYGSEKKGLPTTYYLTIADSHIMHAQRAGARRPAVHQRPDRDPEPANRWRAWSRAGRSSCSRRTPTRPRSGSASRQQNRRSSARRRSASIYCDMVKIAREVASEADLQMRMQGIVLLGAFLKLTPYAKESNMTDEQVYAGVEKALRKYFGKRGDRVVQDNLTCVKRGYSEMKEIPPAVIEA